MPSEFRNLNGYTLVYMPDHPRALSGTGYEGYVYEQIIVAEHMISRTLRGSEVVHHLNFCRSDNRTDNLLVLERSQHSKLHAWLDRGAPGWKRCIAKSEAENKKQVYCLGCAKLLLRKQRKFCSKKCSGSSESRRRVKRPSKDQLEKDLSTLSWCAAGRKYGVSDNAVRKWAKKYDL